MGDILCKLVCWAIAAVIAVVAGTLIAALLAPNGILLFVMSLFVFVIFAWALPLIICGAGLEPVGSPVPVAAAPKPAAPPAPVSKPAPAPAAKAAGSWTDAVSAESGQASAGRGQTGLKPAVAPAEEATLRDGVGAWKYGGDAPAAAPASSGAADCGGEGAKPATLAAARDGGADDLKKIKGVGPKLEALLNSLGFYHFDQIANWTADEVAWVDANLEGFKGRVSRDNWVAQAQTLAGGGETEFSKKVDDGDVY